MKSRMSYSILLVVLLLTSSTWAGTKEEIIRLQSDVLQLQNQIRVLQKNVDEKNEVILSLLEQLNDQSSENNLVFGDVLTAVKGTRADVGQSITQLNDQLQGMSAQLEETNNRVASLHRKLEENQLQIQSLRTVQTAPGAAEVEPDRVYSATFNDYLMGNYALAVDGFQDFLSNYPDSEYADNAAYYLGDAYLQQGRQELAIQAFDQVINLYPNGDKTSVAYYKKAMAQQELQQLEQAIDTFKKLIQLHPESTEAPLAREELNRLGVES